MAMKQKKTKYYVIWSGREPGVYTDWNTAKQLVDDYKGARFKAFDSKEEADKAFADGPQRKYFQSKAKSEPVTERPLTRSVAVDAACSGNPGKMEYRGVSMWDRKEIFHMAFDLGTNNIGEFLAIVHCLGLLAREKATDITIYSDSQIAIGWVRQGKCRTKLEQTPRTVELLSLVKRAETWLANNEIVNPIVKWPTEKWGEIPADFGRK